jgi:hypothetical protein
MTYPQHENATLPTAIGIAHRRVLALETQGQSDPDAHRKWPDGSKYKNELREREL